MAKPEIRDEDPGEKLTPDQEGVSFSAAQDGKETVFVKHPVLPAVKRRIVRSGYRILDAKFAPPGYPIVDGETGEAYDGRKPKGKGINLNRGGKKQDQGTEE